MPNLELKLKQASVVLSVAPKDLQNLVQFGIVKPRLRRRVFWFDRQKLLQARVALYLKETLGASTAVLAQFTKAFFGKGAARAGRSSVTLLSRSRAGEKPVEIRVPLDSLAREIDERLPLAAGSPDLPRGRKRPGWAEEFLVTMRQASSDLRDVSGEDILRTVRDERRRKRAVPEVSVLGDKAKRAAARRR